MRVWDACMMYSWLKFSIFQQFIHYIYDQRNRTKVTVNGSKVFYMKWMNELCWDYDQKDVNKTVHISVKVYNIVMNVWDNEHD